MRYLIIDEDSNVTFSGVVSSIMREACDDGIWSVVDTNTKKFYREGWHDVPTYNPADYIMPEDITNEK